MSVDESRYRPTRQAVFTETMQIGIVVRDLDATLRRYVDDYGRSVASCNHSACRR
jgi:hypothetical protein